jgi:accessory colonization factor AcfC
MMKKAFLKTLMGLTIIWSLGFHCDLGAQDKVLRIYGPEGPFAPMKDCADLFYRVRGGKTEVLTGSGSNWIARAKEEADIVYEETENRLSQFMMRHP